MTNVWSGWWGSIVRETEAGLCVEGTMSISKRPVIGKALGEVAERLKALPC